MARKYRGGGGGGKAITGTEGDDILTASSKGSKVYGLGGNDLLQGSFGRDLLDGGDGNDRLDDNIFGGNLDTNKDTLLGGGGDDYIRSRGGGDLIDGGTGNDTVYVVGGGATIDGGEGFDFASFTINDTNEDIVLDFVAGETLSLSNGTTVSNVERISVGTGSGNDQISLGEFDDRAFGGDGNDVIYGNGGADALYGGNGVDLLDGGAGNDMLIGGGGADILTGGSGADRFRLGSGSDVDRVTDFNATEGDVLDFSDLLLEESASVFTGDPIADGLIRVSDTVEGVLVELDEYGPGVPGDFVSVAILENITTADLGTDFLIV